MMKWLSRLKKKLSPSDDSCWLECNIDGKKQNVKALQISGVGGLLVSLPNGMQRITVRDAVSKTKFWSVWNQLAPSTMVWEDGSEFSPPAQ